MIQRTTPAGTIIYSHNGEDIAHVWQAPSGKHAAHWWADGGPETIRYFDTRADALAFIEQKGL